MCRQSMPEAGSSAAFRSAGRLMNSLDDAQLKGDGLSEPVGLSLGRSHAGLDFWGRQVVTLVMPGDLVARSNIYPRELLEKS